MENLIPVNYDSEQPTVSARDLHEGLGINTDFRKWFPRMTEYGFTENVDWKRVYQKCPTLGGAQNMVDYQISVDNIFSTLKKHGTRHHLPRKENIKT